MEVPSDNEVADNLVRLTTPLTIGDLVNKDGATFELNFEDLQEEEPDQLSYDPEDVLKYVNPGCCDLEDEDTYQDGEPFENLSKKMTDILSEGAIKKRVLREGYGDGVPANSTITIDYNAYVEYNDEPFDSTYLRKRPHTFRLGEGTVIPGLEMAVKSMKLTEKSQFLIIPDYAYGKAGCLQRVPPNASILFEIELKNIIASGAAMSYVDLPEERKRDFTEIYKYAHALCSKANDLYSKGLIKQAIKDYNTAISKLEMCTLRNYEDQEKQQQLLLRLLTNVVVSYTKLQEPRRACTNCNKIYNMCKGTTLKVPAKVYFNHARCLILLSDFEWAERKLKQAQKLEPQNPTITQEFLRLDAKKKESYNREVALAKAIFKNTEINKEMDDKTEVTAEFCKSMTQYCEDLLRDSQSTQYNLPANLTEKELEFCKKEVEKHGLHVKELKDGDNKYCVTKRN